MTSVPTIPFAPGRFSTMNCCLKRSESFGATARQMASLPPPGGKMETIRTGFDGYGCWASTVEEQPSAKVRATERNFNVLRTTYHHLVARCEGYGFYWTSI